MCKVHRRCFAHQREHGLMLHNSLSGGLFPFNEAVTEGARWLGRAPRHIHRGQGQNRGGIQLGFEANSIHGVKWPKLLDLHLLGLPP